MYNEQIEGLISAALADGVLTEKEKQILFKKAQSQGIDLDEFEMVLDARLVELQKAEKEKAEKSAPKSTKYGDVRKCPVCGALVPALAGVCPECGYEFSGVDSNLSSQKLSALIDEIIQDASTRKTELQKSGRLSTTARIKGDVFTPMQRALYDIDDDTSKRIKNTIKNFSIPNTKSDLFEFTISLQTKINDIEYGEEYLAKLEECITKIKLLFPKDPMFVNILEAREHNKKELSKKKGKLLLVNLPIGIVLSAVIAFISWKFMPDSWWWIVKIYIYCLVPFPLLVLFGTPYMKADDEKA